MLPVLRSSLLSHSRHARFRHGARLPLVAALCALTFPAAPTLSAPLHAQEATEAAQNAPSNSPLGPNLLQNGDFAGQGAKWTQELANGKASGKLTWPTDVSVPPGAAGKVARIEIEAIDKERWHLQCYQRGVNLVDGEAYTLTFWAKADQDRPLSISTNVDEGDFHMAGLDSRVSIGRQWRKISLAFTATRASKNRNRLSFMFGEALGYVDLADVRLQSGVDVPAPGPNLLKNPNFESGLASWLTLQVSPPAHATLQVVEETPDGATGKAVHVHVTDIGPQNWYVHFGQNGLSLEEGGVYTLTFWAKSNRNRPLSLHSDVDKDDYRYNGLSQLVALTPEWKKYAFVFTATDTGHVSSRIIFTPGDAIGDVDIAGVSLQSGASRRVVKPVVDPDATARTGKPNKPTPSNGSGRGETRAHRSHPLVGAWQSFHKDVGLTGKEYQRYRFVFDANGGGSLQIATLAEEPDAKPKSQQTENFKWDLVEGGPHVSIGSNVYTWTIEKDGKKQKLTLKNYEGKTYILFRQ